MDRQIAVDTEGAYIELGPAGGGDVTAYLEDSEAQVTVTWSREEAQAVHSMLGHLLYG